MYTQTLECYLLLYFLTSFSGLFYFSSFSCRQNKWGLMAPRVDNCIKGSHHSKNTNKLLPLFQSTLIQVYFGHHGDSKHNYLRKLINSSRHLCHSSRHQNYIICLSKNIWLIPPPPFVNVWKNTHFPPRCLSHVLSKNYISSGYS